MRRPLFLILFLLSTLPFFGQNYGTLGKYPIKNYSPEEYGGHPQNWGIACSSRGTIYAANGEGLIIFDGSQWRKVILPGNAMATAIAVDKNDQVYVSLYRDLGYLAVNALGEYQFVSLINLIPEENREFGKVSRILATDDGVYYIGVKKVYYYTDGILKILDENTNIFNCGVVLGFGFATSPAEGIGIFQKDIFYPLPYLEKFGDNNISRITFLKYDDNRVLITTSLGELYLYNLGYFYNEDTNTYDFGKKNPPEHILEPFTAPDISDAIYNKKAGLRSGLTVHNNLFAFGTQGGGILLMDKQGALISVINQQRGLFDNFVFALTRDPFGNIWGATNNGISHLTLNTPATVWDKSMGINDVPLITYKHGNRIYVGSFGSLYYLDTNDTQIPGRLKTIQGAQKVSWVFLDYKDLLLVGTGRGVQYIKDDTAYDIPLTTFPLYVYTMVQIPDRFPDTVFIGTGGQLLYAKLTLSEDGKSIKHHEIADFGNIRQQLSRWIVPDKDGNLWISTQNNGVYHIKFTGDSINEYEKTYYTTEHGLPSLAWNYLYNIEDTIILTTKTGLMTPVQDKNGSYYFEPYTYYNETLTNAYPMLEVLKDKENRAWVLSHDKTGMTRAEMDENGKYHLKDVQFKGLPKDFHDIFMEDDSIFWLLSFTGVYRYDSALEKDYSTPFYAAINSARTVEEEILFNGAYYDQTSGVDGNFTRFSSSQPDGLVPRLEYKKNNITITYSAAWYEYPEETRFHYFLEGFDPHWSILTDETKAVYTNLPEGEYRFRVKAVNVYGTESVEAEYRFSIVPPWYRTIWAYIGYAILLVGLIWGVSVFTNRYLIRAKQRLEATVQQRTEEIREQNRELEKLSIVVRETDNSVIIMAPNGNIEWANDGFTRIFGDYYIDVIAKKGKNIINWSLDNKVAGYHQKCLAEKQSVQFEHREQRKSGNFIWLQTTLTPLLDENKEVIKLIAIGSNITELKQAEREAVLNAHKAGMADVAVTTIHNVGNILNSVKTTTSAIAEIVKRSAINKFLKANTLLKDNLDDLEEFISNDPKGSKLMEYYITIEDDFVYEHSSVQDRIEKITQGIDSISEVLMTHERYVENISSDVMEEHLDLKLLLEDTLRIQMQSLEENEIHVVKEFTGAPIVKAQKPKMLSVFLALIENAEDALSHQFGKKRQLIIRTSGVLKTVRVEIEDTGCGIERENIRDIFHHGFSTKEGHNGFGLHNAANNITDLGGKIWAESDGSGKGARFIIQFDQG